ncbi:MAG: LapA family protein [Deltaproteobacteria bacterium]|nr:LapA family protein [Deltaproteobacteria bacterium]
MKLIYTILGTLVILFIITFSLKNTIPIQLEYYGFIEGKIPPVPLYLIIFISFGVGVIFAGLLGIVERFRLVRKVSRLEKQIRSLEKVQMLPRTVPAVYEEHPAAHETGD